MHLRRRPPLTFVAPQRPRSDDDGRDDGKRGRLRGVCDAAAVVRVAGVLVLCGGVLLLLLSVVLLYSGVSALRPRHVTHTAALVPGAYVDLDALLHTLRDYAAAQQLFAPHAASDTTVLPQQQQQLQSTAVPPRPHADAAPVGDDDHMHHRNSSDGNDGARVSLTHDYVRRFVRAASPSPSQQQHDTTRAHVTPEAVLHDYYFSTTHGLPYMNAEAERDVHDEGYVPATSSLPRSDTFYDAAHTLRRGYGMEGSVFVVLPFVPDAASWPSLSSAHDATHDAARTSVAAATAATTTTTRQDARVHATRWPVYTHAACARTLHSVFADARWPAALTVATAEYAMTTRCDDDDAHTATTTTAGASTHAHDHSTTSSTTTTAAAALSRRWVLSCVPAGDESARSHEHRGLRYGDQVRVRHIRVPPLCPARTHHDTRQQPQPPSLSSLSRASYTSLHALRAALLRLYAGESYVLFVQPGSALVPAWDWKARLLYTQAPRRTRAVLSTRPRHARRVVWSTLVARVVDDTLPLTATTMTTARATASTATRDDSAATATAQRHDAAMGDSTHDVRDTQQQQQHCLAALVTPRWLHKRLGRVMSPPSHRGSTTSNDDDDGDDDGGALLRRACATVHARVRGASMTADEVIDMLWLPPVSTDADATQQARDGVATTAAAHAPRNGDVVTASASAACQHELQQQLQSLLASAATDTTPPSAATWLHKRAYEACWLQQHRAWLRQALAIRLARDDVVAVLTPQCDRDDDNDDDNDDSNACTSPLHYRVVPRAVPRTSDSLRDVRYLRARDVVAMRDTNDNATTTSTTAAAAAPLLATQPVVSTAFLFARAEAFVSMPATLQLQFAPVASRGGDDNDNDDGDAPPPPPVTLSDFVSRARADDVDMLLSAQLWTRGWELYAPSEPLCYDVTSHEQQQRQQPQQPQHDTADAAPDAHAVATDAHAASTAAATLMARLRGDTLRRLHSAVAHTARQGARAHTPTSPPHDVATANTATAPSTSAVTTMRSCRAPRVGTQRTLADYLAYLRACDDTTLQR